MNGEQDWPKGSPSTPRSWPRHQKDSTAWPSGNHGALPGWVCCPRAPGPVRSESERPAPWSPGERLSITGRSTLIQTSPEHVINSGCHTLPLRPSAWEGGRDDLSACVPHLGSQFRSRPGAVIRSRAPALGNQLSGKARTPAGRPGVWLLCPAPPPPSGSIWKYDLSHDPEGSLNLSSGTCIPRCTRGAGSLSALDIHLLGEGQGQRGPPRPPWLADPVGVRGWAFPAMRSSRAHESGVLVEGACSPRPTQAPAGGGRRRGAHRPPKSPPPHGHTRPYTSYQGTAAWWAR